MSRIILTLGIAASTYGRHERTTNRARLALATLASFALFLWCATAARASVPPLAERVKKQAVALGSKIEPSVDPQEFAAVAVAAARGDREVLAFLLATAHHESALSARIAAGRCRPRECDRGKAWGLWQQHRSDFTRAAWGSTSLNVQADTAAAALKRAFYYCSPMGKRAPDWIARTFSAYAGLRCDAQWPGLAARVATFERVRARL